MLTDWQFERTGARVGTMFWVQEFKDQVCAFLHISANILLGLRDVAKSVGQGDRNSFQRS
jgi:hypothetical protein